MKWIKVKRRGKKNDESNKKKIFYKYRREIKTFPKIQFKSNSLPFNK